MNNDLYFLRILTEALKAPNPEPEIKKAFDKMGLNEEDVTEQLISPSLLPSISITNVWQLATHTAHFNHVL